MILSAVVLLLAACLGEIKPGSVQPADLPDPLTLARTGRPNDWLICPPGTCRAETDHAAPIYPVPPAELWRAWQAVLAAAPLARPVAADDGRRLLLAQDRTPVFRFIDTVAVHVLPAGDGGSTFAAYSRSELGYSDLGVNRRRLEAWVEAVERRLRTGA